MPISPRGPHGHELLATADRLQERTERLADSTARLRMRAKRLEKATARLRKMTEKLERAEDGSPGSGSGPEGQR